MESITQKLKLGPIVCNRPITVKKNAILNSIKVNKEDIKGAKVINKISNITVKKDKNIPPKNNSSKQHSQLSEYNTKKHLIKTMPTENKINYFVYQNTIPKVTKKATSLSPNRSKENSNKENNSKKVFSTPSSGSSSPNSVSTVRMANRLSISPPRKSNVSKTNSPKAKEVLQHIQHIYINFIQRP